MFNPLDYGTEKSQILNNFKKEFEEFFEFLDQDPLFGSVIFKFHPDNCRSTRDNPDRRFIGIAPSDHPVMENLARDLELFYNDKNNDGLPDFVIQVRSLYMKIK
eukprot:403370896